MVLLRGVEHRREFGASIAEFALANEATHFCTLKPGIHGLSHFDSDRELRPVVGAFFRDYARVRNSIPWRREIAAGDLPFIIGVAERFDRFGNIDPHFHFMIALREDEDALLRGFARKRWGVDMTEGAEDLLAIAPPAGVAPAMRDFLFPEAVPLHTSPRSWLFQGSRYSPSFDLQPITSTPKRVGMYMTKQANDPTIWNHLELFDSSKAPAKQHTKTPSRRRA